MAPIYADKNMFDVDFTLEQIIYKLTLYMLFTKTQQLFRYINKLQKIVDKYCNFSDTGWQAHMQLHTTTKLETNFYK